MQCPRAAPLPGTGGSVVRGYWHRGAQVEPLIGPKSFHGLEVLIEQTSDNVVIVTLFKLKLNNHW